MTIIPKPENAALEDTASEEREITGETFTYILSCAEIKGGGKKKAQKEAKQILLPPWRALSQFWSFEIRRTTFLNYIKFVDPRILRL